MKKNTMLTIEQNLIDKSRLFGLNISEIASRALEQEIAMWTAMDIPPFIPQVKRLKLQNIGWFERANFIFGKGINLIVGDNGSGKTTILRSLSYVLHRRYYPNLLRYGKTNGSIEVELFSKKIKCSLTTQPSTDRLGMINLFSEPEKCLSAAKKKLLYLNKVMQLAKSGEAVMLDELLGYLDKPAREKAVTLLKQKQRKTQIITATTLLSKELLKLPEATIFEIKVGSEGKKTTIRKVR